MNKPLIVQPIARPLEAMQYRGTYGPTEDLLRWVNGRLIIFPVPSGYGHPLRRDSEHDRSNGHILEHAAPFLAVYLHSNSTKPTRVDQGCWFVADDDEIKILTAAEFDLTYEIKE